MTFVYRPGFAGCAAQTHLNSTREAECAVGAKSELMGRVAGNQNAPRANGESSAWIGYEQPSGDSQVQRERGQQDICLRDF